MLTYDSIAAEFEDIREFRRGSNLGVPHDEACAIIAAAKCLYLPNKVVARAFGLSLVSTNRILTGRTHRAAYDEFSRANHRDFVERYINERRLAMLKEARAGTPKPPRQAPPKPGAGIAKRFAGTWKAYGDFFDVHMTDGQWALGSNPNESGSKRFDSSEAAFEFGLAVYRSDRVDEYSAEMFRITFKEQPEWPRSEWLSSNWRRPTPQELARLNGLDDSE